MISVAISPAISRVCPSLVIGIISCNVTNTPSSDELKNEINEAITAFRTQYQLADINKIRTIKATRQAYKALGKDPNRCRPYTETLCRKIVKNIPLYHINTLVDLINLISIQTGYSIGGFDAAKIQGNITLTIGNEDDVFDAIGRGLLNIGGFPVYKDDVGSIGTPTSDNQSTKIGLNTTQLFMIINAYSGIDGLEDTTSFAARLLRKYAMATDIEMKIEQT
jgi:DNA/RNA-binding domain of Phe-tRNA-synthetase-like protein